MKFCKNFLLLIPAWLLTGYCANAQLQANFTANKNGGCSPVAISFTNTSAGASANAIYKWDFGNGNTSTSMNAAAIYQEEKNYTVTLTVQDGGKQSTKTQTVTVYAKPAINDITISVPKGCLPLSTVFTATAAAGSGSINSYLWDFGDGNTQQGYSASQQHTYTTPQKASISLTVTNSYGCTVTAEKKEIAEIIPAIGASFSASQTILCRETDAVQFTNNSYGPGTLSYLWDFGDGTTSTLKAPAHSFGKKGIYTVKLTVTSSEGCVISSTQVGYINVAMFSSDFTGPAPICKGSTINFNAVNSPYASNSSWEVDGVPAYYYSGYLYYIFNTPGDHTIKLKNIFGTCPDSITKTISVKEIPYPNGFKDTILGNCGAPVTVNFTDTTLGAVKWEWSFDAYYNYNRIDATTQAPSYTYRNDGGFDVLLKVTNADGCYAYTRKSISIRAPSVSISADKNTVSCGPVTMQFTANASEEIVSYNWQFSDGSRSADKQPTHVFSTPGTHHVVLSYVTKSGCTGNVSYADIQVYNKPVVDFTASGTTICGNTPVIFSAKSQGGDNLVYYWDFGDGSSPVANYNSSSITYQYNTDAVYTVRLIVANGGNCRDTMTKTNYLTVLPPFPKITGYTNTCDGTRGTVTFTQASRKAVTWTWDFGDGTPTTTLTTDQPSISHTYTKTGNYTVSLAVTNGQCTVRDVIRSIVLLKQNPVFNVAQDPLCVNQQFLFQINNIERNPYPNSWDSYYFIKWQYEDGSNFKGYYNTYYNYQYWTSNVQGIASSYSADTVKVRAVFQSAGFGCNDTTNYITLRFNNARAGFKVESDKQCWQQPVQFSDTSLATGSNKIIRRDWNFGDGTTQTFTEGGLVTHRYTNPGQYTVSLSVTDMSGCNTSLSAVKTVEVNGPKASFGVSANTTTITLPVYFYNYTNNYNSYNTQYKWDFGDGATAIDFNPVHTYISPGTYTVTMVALNPVSGCFDTARQTIKVLNFSPAFSLNSTVVSGKCPPVLVRFSNNSVNYTSVKWDFGDGITADNLNYPSHVYEKPGKYIVTLYVYGVSGLKATYTDSVTIQAPFATLKTNASEICKGDGINFDAVATNTGVYLWDFGDGNVQATTDALTKHVYNTAGIFKPAIMVTDGNGCAAVTPLGNTIDVHANPEPVFSPAHPVVCKGSAVQINTTGGTVYEWTPALGLSDPGIASPYASPVVNTTYTVTVKDNIGCTGTAAVDVIVGQPFTLKASHDTSICLGKQVPLIVSGAATYQWINNITGLSNAQSATPFAAPIITTAYTVTGADQYHCFSDTAHITVKVMPLPVVHAGQDVEVLGGTPVQLTATADNDVVQWNWSPATYLNCNTCPAPVSTPMAQTAYTVTVTNRNGCAASDTVVVKLQCYEDKVRIPNAFTPNNDNSNDVFMIKGISLVKHLVIFDRWGEKVFERNNFIASDRSSCWNGTYKGSPATAGSYVYFAEMQCPSGGVFVMKGSVLLIR